MIDNQLLSCLNLNKTIFYIDYYLNNTNGFIVAKKLHDYGFEKLYISTGKSLFNIPYYIKGVVDKVPNFKGK